MNALNSLRTHAVARWQALTPREQRSLSLLGALLALLLFWSVAIAPALNTLRDSDSRRAQIGQEHAHMLALQAQAKALQTRTPLSREEALRQLQSLTPSPSIQLTTQGDRVSVQLKAVSASTLAQWLAQARQHAQALPLEAHLTRNTAGPGQNLVLWDGHLVLSLPKRTPN